MGLKESPERKVGYDVAIVDEERFVFIEQVLDVLEPPRGVEEDGLMAKEDRPSPPAPFGKRPVVRLWAVVGVDDEPLDPDREAVVHREGDERTAADRQERLGALFGQGPEAGSQPRSEDEGRPDHKHFK